MDKPHRFFYHFNKGKKAMSVHWQGQCLIVNDVDCRVRAKTKWNKRQPMLVMQGYARQVDIVLEPNMWTTAVIR
jgi:hypothetical protein